MADLTYDVPAEEAVAALLARSNRLGSRSAQHQLRGRQRLGQGHRDRPGDRPAGRADVGEGLRRRPRHADRGGPGGAAPRPAARAGRRLPRGRARGRDGRRVRLLRVRQGRRRPVDRHRDARPGRGGARRPPAPGRGHRVRDRRRRGEADPRVLRRPGRVGAVAAARVPARPRHRRHQARAPRGDRGDPRRPRHHRLGADQRRVRGALAGDHRRRAEIHRRARSRRVRSGNWWWSRCRRPSAGRGRPPSRR